MHPPSFAAKPAHLPNDNGIDRHLPKVSVLVPVRNEAPYIESLLNGLAIQDYPSDKLEIWIADGMSDDGTREILERHRHSDARIHVVDNPHRIVPTGLNQLICRAKGDVLMRIDGHSEIPRDYIITSIQILQAHPEAWGVGGPIVHVGTSPFGKATAVAMSHPVGVGNATHRFADFEGYGEGTAFWTFHRWVFEQVGLFDESLVRTEDDEFNFRVTQAGGKIYLSPAIRSRYFVRDSIRKLAVQYFQYSFWRIPVMRKHRRPTTVRQMIPVLFYTCMLALGVAGIFCNSWAIALSLPIIYLLTLIAIGVSKMRQVGFLTALLVPVAVLTMHASYAAGMACGCLGWLFRINCWRTEGMMTKLSR